MIQNDDTISRQAAIDALDVLCQEHRYKIPGKQETYSQYNEAWQDALDRAEGAIGNLPPAQPVDKDIDAPVKDCISRQMLLEYIHGEPVGKLLCDKYNLDGLIEQFPSAQSDPQWVPCSERLPSKEERKEWIDNNLDGIGYLYPCLVTRYSRFDSDRVKNNPYVAKHYFDGEDFLNAGEEVCSEYIVAWMPLPEPYAERITK